MKTLLLVALLIFCGSTVWAHDHTMHHDIENMAPGPVSSDSVYNIDSPWTNQDGATVHLSELRGHPVVMAMIYTSCTSACPITVTSMKEIESKLPEALRPDVKFVLVSFDPDRDTRAKLKDYAKQRGLDSPRWSLLHGDSAQIRELAAALGVKYKKNSSGDFDHSNVISILDQQGKIDYQKIGLGGPVDEAVSHVQKLASDGAKARADDPPSAPVSVPAAAPSESKALTVHGQFRLRAEGDDKTDYSTSRDFIPLRVRAAFEYKVDPSLSLVLTPQFSRSFGEPTWTAAPNTGTFSQQQTSGGIVDPSFGVHEAYADYKAVPWLEFKAGRQVLSYGDELILGALDWNNVGRSFDAAKLRTTYSWGWSDVFVSKLVDTNTASSGPGDTDFYGLYNSFSFLGENRPLDLYFLYQNNGAATPSVTNVSALGVRTAGPADRFDYRLELTKEFGSALPDEPNAYQGDAEIGYTLVSPLKPRASLEGFIAGRDYNQLYPTWHKWLGYADVLGRSNLTGGAVHVSMIPFESALIKVDEHFFSRTATDAALIKANGTTLGTATGSSSADVGSETDLTLSYQSSQNLTWLGGFSYFASGSYLTDQFGQVNPVFYFVQMDVHF